jgi:hypothetical protein
MIDNDGGREAANIPHPLFGVANGLVQLVVDRGVLARTDRLAGCVERGGHAGCIELALNVSRLSWLAARLLTGCRLSQRCGRRYRGLVG